VINALHRALRPLHIRIANLISRAVVKRVNDQTKLQLLQVGALAEETRDAVERLQSYGFTSVPFAGAEAVLLFIGGRRDHPIAIAVDDRRHRFSGLQPGEVAVYTDEGDHLALKRGGAVRLEAGTKLEVSAPAVELSGNVEAALLGTSYRGQEDAVLTALSAALTALSGQVPNAPALFTPAHLAAFAAAIAAISAFQAAGPSFLSQKVKVG
jgi:phage baseplate assembly protein V